MLQMIKVYRNTIYALNTIFLVTACAPNHEDNEKPNIIVLLVDDAGYADFGFNGCLDLETPNIDKLANKGVVFTDAHVTATVCGPSRAGLLFGRYQQRFGFECNPLSDTCGVDLKEASLAAQLKKGGYQTAAFGKWHLGNQDGYRPNQRGFDYFWGFLSGGRNYFPNAVQDKPGHTHSVRENNEFYRFEGYLTDCLGDMAVEFIDKNKENPFFIYWAPNAVHTPLEATKEDLAKYENHPRQMLAAMTLALDRAVGDIIDKLEQENILDNTLIFFLSDNGGAHNNYSSNAPLKGFKGNKFEGGHRVPFFVHWPAKIKGNRKYNQLTSSLDIYATAIDAAGIDSLEGLAIDGVSLIPFLTGKKTDAPHQQLFWRKDKFAAARINQMKLIRSEGLPTVMYNVEHDLQETENLAETEAETFEKLNTALTDWESQIMNPLWLEEESWNTVTWLIHKDLIYNHQVKVKNPQQLVNIKKD